MISQRAWLIGGVGFCFYLIAIVNTLPSFYYALTWLSVGVLASSLGIALLSLVGLRCAWRAPRAVVSQSLDEHSSHEATGPVIEVQMANAGTLNKTGVVIEARILRLDPKNDAAPKRPEYLTRRFLLEALPSSQSLTTHLPLSHLPRGRYRVEELRLSGSDPLGLFRIEKRVPMGLTMDEAGKISENSSQNSTHGQDELIVGPATLPAPETVSLNLASSRGEGSVTATRSLGMGDDIRGTRLYTPGDDLRHVHWKSTARKKQLVVKEFHHTYQTRALVVWDGAAGTNLGRANSNLNTLEWGLALTASLCRVMEERHLPCTLLKLDNHPQQMGQGANGRQTANASLPNAALTMSQVAEMLSDADADRTSSLVQTLSTLPAGAFLKTRDPHGGEAPGEVFLITASLSTDVARVVSLWRVSGARVTVALLDGAAFAKKVRRGLHAPEPAPNWSTPAPGAAQRKAKPDGETAITPEKYEAQAHVLRQAGARVVLVAPRAASSDSAPLNTALYALLHKDEVFASQRQPQPGQKLEAPTVNSAIDSAMNSTTAGNSVGIETL